MPELVQQTTAPPTLVSPAGRIPPATGGRARVTEDVERLARDDLRRQIGELERELGELFATTFPRRGIEFGVPAAGGPRVLDVADLEAVRDALVSRLQDARAELSARVDVEERNRELIERMIVEPERHRWIRVSNEDIGEPGCRHWHSRPRWGLLGMILNWWRVRLSSGCPLPSGRGQAASRPNKNHDTHLPVASYSGASPPRLGAGITELTWPEGRASGGGAAPLRSRSPPSPTRHREPTRRRRGRRGPARRGGDPGPTIRRPPRGGRSPSSSWSCWSRS